MNLQTLLIANRGEIAIRIGRAAAELGARTVAVFSEDDTLSLHLRTADECRPLKGAGPAAYLDIEQILTVAREAQCDAIHPGYGFLSENAAFARRCADVGITFVGPRPEILELFGDKSRARALALSCGVPVLAGTSSATSLDETKAFFASLSEPAAIMIKAIAGGGGRGMRMVSNASEIEEAYARCQSEARAAFGNGDVYVEQFMPKARHIEIQIAGDGRTVSHLGERECSLQRQNQKIVEIAPSPALSETLRRKLAETAVRLAEAVGYNNLGTFEFLVGDDEAFAFLETNPRLQVEHTVTEEVTGVDLVKTQLQLAAGRSLEDLGLLQSDVPAPRGFAIELRINMETMDSAGRAKPASGTLSRFEAPSGPGIRVDTFGYPGYRTSPRFDSLLAKLIAHSYSREFARDYGDVVTRAGRALAEFHIEGVATNISYLQTLLRHPDVRAGAIYTRFTEDHAAEFCVAQAEDFAPAPGSDSPVSSPMRGRVISIDVAEGDLVHKDKQVAVLEAMKMEHIIRSGRGGRVRLINVAVGETVSEGHPLVFIEEVDVESGSIEEEAAFDPDAIRPDLAKVLERHAIGLDENRPDAVERRRKTGQRTARENVADLCDPGSFVEYGALQMAAQRSRHAMDKLIRMSPADGMVAGLGSVNGRLFDPSRSRCLVMAYDYTVLAGTQGAMNHKKKDRMLGIAEQYRLPVVVFAEGGGGRPGDTDWYAVAGLDVMTFHGFAKLSGLAPLVGIVSGRCFAGNAALLGCCDVIIATANSNIGMGGPAMIEGGGLGVFAPEDVGPIGDQSVNGVVDIVVSDEAEAVCAAKKYLSYFQGRVTEWKAGDQRVLRRLVPEKRLRVYDVRAVIHALADTDSVLELRSHFGLGMITALIRVEGRPMGLIANNPMHLAGAIDADGADKAARFMQLCEAFGLPMLSLCDTPGFMVGPEIEKKAQVRHVCRMFVTGANLSVPFFVVVLRKGYGLGAQSMAGGSFHAPFFLVSWPTGEFGGMGLEGAVKLGFRRELAAIQDAEERQRLFEKMVAEKYADGQAINMASFFELDAVIDPCETRRWILRGLDSLPPPASPSGKRRPFIDTW